MTTVTINKGHRAGTLPELPPNFFWTARKRPEDVRYLDGIRSAYGLTGTSSNTKLLTYDTYKIAKGDGLRILNLSLAPHKLSGFNLCPSSTSDCRANCIGWYSGLNKFPDQQLAKLWRTEFLYSNFPAFMRLLLAELNSTVRNHGPVALRLNTYSDLNWSPVSHMIWGAIGEDSISFEYTKRKEFVSGARPKWGKQYTHFAYSAKGRRFDDPEYLAGVVSRGHNVAIVCDRLPTGKTLFGRPWVNGDDNDRNVFLHSGKFIVLLPKGTLNTSSDFVYTLKGNQ